MVGWDANSWSGHWIPTSIRSFSARRYSPIGDEQQLRNRLKAWRWYCLTAGVVLCSAGVWASRALPEQSGASTSSTSLGRTGLVDVRLRVFNSYTKDNPIEKYPFEYIAEPYRSTILEIESWTGLDDNVEYRWDIQGEVRGNGAILEMVFESTGQYQCSVTAIPRSPWTRASGWQSAQTHRFTVFVKYVRRELRELTDRDRETFLNAISVMQRVPSSVGRMIYGSKYYSKDYINRIHMYYGFDARVAGWCEAWGLHRVKISLRGLMNRCWQSVSSSKTDCLWQYMFKWRLLFNHMDGKSLQAINPSIAVPYWDFTIEGTFYEGPFFRESGVFASDWFGTARPKNVLRTPDDGRFAFVPTMMNASEFSVVTNAYGMLRSPWNTDNTPFMTRHDHLFGFENNLGPSGCTQYQQTVASKNWMDLTKMFNNEAHGHLHELLGGAWSKGFGSFSKRASVAVIPFLHKIQPYAKMLWRAGFFTCPDECGVDIPWSQCQCTCKQAADGLTPSEMLEESGVLASAFFFDRNSKLIDTLVDNEGHALYTIPGYSVDETHDIFAQLMDVLCTPARIGTNYEGSSTNDPIFWVLHPTIDRAWHLSRLESKNFDSTWRSDNPCFGHNPEDTQPFHGIFKDAVRSRPESRSTQANLTHSASGNKNDAPSVGASHGKFRGYDVTYPREGSLISQSSTEVVKERLSEVQSKKLYYTNEDLYELFRPDRWDMPYVYNNFEWPHCEAIALAEPGGISLPLPFAMRHV